MVTQCVLHTRTVQADCWICYQPTDEIMLHAYMHMAGCKNTVNWVPFLSELEQYRKYCMAKMTCTDQAMAFRILSSQST